MSTPLEMIHIPLKQLVLSETPMQRERRKHRTAADIKELADTMASVGQLHPIIVRPFKVVEAPGLNGVHIAGKTYFSPDEIEEIARNTYEIVAGEGRYLAAEVAGIDKIRAEIRDLTDEQVEVIQLIENLRRKGVHELVEAEGYEALLKRGHTVDEIVAETGATSKSYVYARMKLLALGPDARKAFRDGKVSASIALLLARIPIEELQKKALAEVTEEDRWQGPMSYREASDHIQREYMLRLKEAPFPVGDLMLVPSAGGCAMCPKNTATQRELFADVEKASAGVCTDPVCFKAKRVAWGTRQLEQAQASGKKVIDGEQAKKIAKSEHSIGGGYVKLDDTCYEDPRYRKYREVLGKKFEPTLLRIPETGAVIEVVQKSAVADLLPASAKSNSYQAQQRNADKKRKTEQDFRLRLADEVRQHTPAAFTREDLNTLAVTLYEGMGHDTRKQLVKLWGWTDGSDKPMDPYRVREILPAQLVDMKHNEVMQIIFDCMIANELVIYSHTKADKPEVLLSLARRCKIDTDGFRKDLVTEAKAKAKAPAKASTKKKSKKKK